MNFGRSQATATTTTAAEKKKKQDGKGKQEPGQQHPHPGLPGSRAQFPFSRPRAFCAEKYATSTRLKCHRCSDHVGIWPSAFAASLLQSLNPSLLHSSNPSIPESFTSPLDHFTRQLRKGHKNI